MGDNSTSFRAHCLMSILIYGNDSSKTKGFSNEIHVDPLDTLPSNFGDMARQILDELSQCDDIDLEREIMCFEKNNGSVRRYSSSLYVRLFYSCTFQPK